MNQPGVSTGAPEESNRRKVTMYRNGSIYTAADPFATAMVVDGDTVAWVGSEQAATSIADSSMEIIDLRGALLAPGFRRLAHAPDRNGARRQWAGPGGGPFQPRAARRRRLRLRDRRHPGPRLG